MLIGDGPMNDEQDMLRKKYSDFFKQAYARGTVTRGILDATRPNTGEIWDAAGDIERSKVFADEFAKESLEAIDRLSHRQQ